MNAREIPGLDHVLDADVYEHCFSTTDREVGGILVGAMQRGTPPSVRGSIRALRASSGAAQVTFTQDAWADIHRVLDQEYPSLAIVGWYHTHPGYGVFLSEQDLFIHRHFFQHRSQIALVVDPLRRQEGVYAWSGGDVEEYYRRPIARRATARARPGERPEAGRKQRTAAATSIYLAIIAVSIATIIWELLLK